MNESTIEKPLKLYSISVVALLLGIAFDYLFFRKFIGISVGIFVAAIIGCSVLFSLKSQASLRKASWLMVLALFFSVMVAVRANLFLSVLNIIAVIGLLLLSGRVLIGKNLLGFTVKNYIVSIVVVPFQMLERSFQSLSALFAVKTNAGGRWKPVFKGIAMALPFLIIFILLFAGADMAFNNFLTTLFSFNLSIDIVWQLIIIICLAIACLGYFSYIFITATTVSSSAIADPSNEESKPVDRRVETKVFLWLIVALFLVFIIFQIAYLFGGAINIGEAGLTYAEYARRGFWELLAVAVITLLLLFAMDFYTRKSEARLSWFTVPSLILTGEIFIIIISALKRMMLYQAAYGWTTLRLYVIGFIIFLAIVFIVLGFKLLREKKNSFFTFVVLLAMIAYLLTANLINADRFIARQNIQRFNETGKIDAAYLGTMSADATAEVVSIFDRLSTDEKGVLQKQWLWQKQNLEKQSGHWQSYNYSRIEALHVLSDFFSQQTFLNKSWKFPVLKEISSALKKYDTVLFFSPDNDHMEWTQNDYTLYLKDAESIQVNYCALSDELYDGQTPKFYYSTPLGEINKEISAVLTQNGYKPEQKNTTALEIHSDYIQGYQKDAVVCRIELPSASNECGFMDSAIAMHITCATGTDKATVEQKPLLDFLDLKGTNSSAYPFKKVGSFILVQSTYGMEGTDGTEYILKVDKGKYTLLDESAGGGWNCSKMDELKVPKEIYGDCRDPASGELRN